jgi:hypothetical protein
MVDDVEIVRPDGGGTTVVLRRRSLPKDRR